MTANLAAIAEASIIDDRHRGMPPGTPPMRLSDVASQGWSVSGEDLCLPVLTLTESSFDSNLAILNSYAGERGLHLCIHGKTMMAPQLLARALQGSRTVGLCAATIQQATVMAACGAPSVLVANQVVGRANLRKLAELVCRHSATRFLVLIDSARGLEDLLAHTVPSLPPERSLELVVEVGVAQGRTGLRDLASVNALVAELSARQRQGARVRLAGVACYEGAVPAGPGHDSRVAALFELAHEAYELLIKAGLTADPPPIISAGGSASFDLVVKAFGHRDYAVSPQIWLRPGVAPVYDHVVYRDRLSQMDARQGFVLGGEVRSAVATFRPALALWAAVQSVPDGDVAIVAAGLRDFPADAGYPTLLAHYRKGRRLAEFPPGAHSMSKANDQHGYLPLVDGLELVVGDVLKFGISHPCTAFDKWPVVFLVDEDDRVTGAIRTYF